MAEASLRISVTGGDDLRRALGAAAAAARQASNQIARENLRRLADEKRAQERASREAERAARNATRIAERERRERLKIVQREAKEVERMALGMVKARERAEREMTRAAERLSAQRSRAIFREYRDQQTLARQAERRATRDRERAVASGGRRGADIARQLGGATMQFASQMHGQIQDARQRRGMTERTLGGAIFQAGGGRTETQAAMQQVTQFAAQHGMDSAELANAIAAAQTEFSALGEDTSKLRERISGMLETARLGRNTGNDPGEFLRLDSMLAGQRVDPETRRQLLLFSAGAAQRGAVETGDITRSAMGSMLARMNQARERLGANATAEQRQAATRDAFVQTMSELQVAKSLGVAPGEAGNVLRNLNSSLAGNATQDRMLTNIRTSRGAGSNVENALFETRGGQRRLRGQFQDATALAGELSRLGLSSTEMGNMFAGGGRGNHQSLQANWRRMVGGLMSADAEGVTGVDRVRRLMDVQRTSLGGADIARGEGLFEHDTQATLTGARERADNALTDNTSAIVRLSNTIENWRIANPWASTGVGVAGGLAGSAGGAILGAGGGAIGRAAPGLLATGGTSLAAAGGGTTLAAAGAGGILGLGIGEGLNRLANFVSQDLIGNRRGTVEQDSFFSAQTWTVLGATIREAFRSSSITATISPIDAAQTRSLAATGTPQR